MLRISSQSIVDTAVPDPVPHCEHHSLKSRTNGILSQIPQHKTTSLHAKIPNVSMARRTR